MPAEVPHSPGIAISHMPASIETEALRHETISPDLSICAYGAKIHPPSKQHILYPKWVVTRVEKKRAINVLGKQRPDCRPEAAQTKGSVDRFPRKQR